MRVVVVPSTLALLPEYASIEDPIATLRTAVLDAVEWLLADGPAAVRAATPAAKQIGAELLEDFRGSGPGLLVVANGTATRTEKAPGHLDEREALAGDLGVLGELDLAVAAELWATDVEALATLARFTPTSVQIDYDDAPYGVQYWVVRYECES
jgi:hypothetical protein